MASDFALAIAQEFGKVSSETPDPWTAYQDAQNLYHQLGCPPLCGSR